MTSPDRSDILGKALHSRPRAVALAAAAAVALAVPAPAHAKEWGGLNADRSIAYFSSDFGLAAGDTNSSTDLYANDAGTTTLVSGGQGPGANEFQLASEDGSVVYFATKQPLAPGDSGDTRDLYVRTPAGIQRITPPSAAGSVIPVLDITPDGSRAWLQTELALVPSDTDAAFDVYEYRPATKHLVLVTHANAEHAFFEAGSVDGTTVWISTYEGVSGTDTDGKLDVYRIKTGAYLPLTPGTAPHHMYVEKVGRTTETMLFTTVAPLVASDVDGETDIYRRVGMDPVELVTTSSAGAAGKPVTFEAADPEGGRVVFTTAEALVAGDVDTAPDVYAVEDGVTWLLSGGPNDGTFHVVEAVTDNAQTVLIGTVSKLLPSDTDSSYDLYRSSNLSKTLTHVNPTNNAFIPVSPMMSPSSGFVAWETKEPLAADDEDESLDIYTFSSGLGIQFASGRAPDSPAGGPVGDDLKLHTVLPNGHVIFSTSERLAATDKDDAKDLYQYGGLQLIHVSRDSSPPDTALSAPGTVPEGKMTPIQAGRSEQGTIECRVDDSDWFACPSGTSNVGPLGLGTHNVQARATDVAGNVDPTPASVTVVVQPTVGAADVPVAPGAGPTSAGPVPAPDTLAPQLTNARLRLRRAAPTLSLTVNEGSSLAVRLQRRVDGRWKTVRSLTRGVAGGSHRIKLARRVGSGKHRAWVLATDPAGNAGVPLKLALRR